MTFVSISHVGRLQNCRGNRLRSGEAAEVEPGLEGHGPDPLGRNDAGQGDGFPPGTHGTSFTPER